MITRSQDIVSHILTVDQDIQAAVRFSFLFVNLKLQKIWFTNQQLTAAGVLDQNDLTWRLFSSQRPPCWPSHQSHSLPAPLIWKLPSNMSLRRIHRKETDCDWPVSLWLNTAMVCPPTVCMVKGWSLGTWSDASCSPTAPRAVSSSFRLKRTWGRQPSQGRADQRC